MKYLLIIIIIFLSINAYSQTIWGIELGDKSQYEQWGESADFDGTVYKQKDGVDFWGKAIYKNDSLEMYIKYPSKEQFDNAFLLLVNEYGEPSIFGDKDLKLEREKEEQKGDYTKKEEQGKVDERSIEAIIQDGDLVMARKWMLVDYEIDLVWDKSGLRLICAYARL
jgi:hypothetical protein